MAQPLVIGRPLPRAGEAYAASAKWDWMLTLQGHGREWAQVFRVGPEHADLLWAAISEAVLQAPVIEIRAKHDGAFGCRVDVAIAIGGRAARVRTAWHYTSVTSAPRLVTAFPTP